MALSESVLQAISTAADDDVRKTIAETLLSTSKIEPLEDRQEAIGAVMVGAITALARIAWGFRDEETIAELAEMVGEIFEEALAKCEAEEETNDEP